MGKKKSPKKATSKIQKGFHQKNESPSDGGSIAEEFTIISDADIHNAISNLTLQPGVPVAGTSGHATCQSESSQTSSSETANTTGLHGNKPTAVPPCATKAKQKTNRSNRSRNKDKDKSEDSEAWQNWDQELLDALTAVKLQFEIESGLENSIKDMDEIVKKIIDEGRFAFDHKDEPTARPSAEQIEKEFHLDQLRVLYRDYKEASEKSIAEVQKRNEEVIWKMQKWRAERVMEAIKSEQMRRIFALIDVTGEGFGDGI
ncbi:hypothetical protein EAF04_010080 [Stromatinia cepivora]|nr:hypothetical protein EAF04_010080 [Stromatinia cepivora]